VKVAVALEALQEHLKAFPNVTLHQIPGVPNSVNTKMVMIMTMIKKFVPQRTCTVE
jgi:hypothetical protein